MSIDEKIEGINAAGAHKGSYSVAEAGAILGVTRQTVYKLIKQGCFKAVKVHDGYRIVKASFDKWLNGETNNEEG